jgi:hypothetical protein
MQIFFLKGQRTLPARQVFNRMGLWASHQVLGVVARRLPPPSAFFHRRVRHVLDPLGHIPISSPRVHQGRIVGFRRVS